MVQREREPLPIYLHLVWGTWDRLPMLSEEMSKQVYHAIGAKCRELDAQVIAIGGTEDHVHLLARLPATMSVADLLKHAKGASSHLVTHRLAPGQSFKWQGSYGACSVSPRHLAQVSDYIARQREHQAAGTLIASLEHEPPSQPA